VAILVQSRRQVVYLTEEIVGKIEEEIERQARTCLSLRYETF